MKRNTRKYLRLGDLIQIVSKLSRNDHETGVVVADMLNRGLIRCNCTMRHHKTVSR